MYVPPPVCGVPAIRETAGISPLEWLKDSGGSLTPRLQVLILWGSGADHLTMTSFLPPPPATYSRAGRMPSLLPLLRPQPCPTSTIKPSPGGREKTPPDTGQPPPVPAGPLLPQGAAPRPRAAPSRQLLGRPKRSRLPLASAGEEARSLAERLRRAASPSGFWRRAEPVCG